MEEGEEERLGVGEETGVELVTVNRYLEYRVENRVQVTEKHQLTLFWWFTGISKKEKKRSRFQRDLRIRTLMGFS